MTVLESGNWGSQPTIPYTISYNSAREGANMVYIVKVQLGAVSGSSYFGYPITVSATVGTQSQSHTLKEASPSQWQNLSWTSQEFTIRASSGTVPLSITLGTSAPRGSQTFSFTLPVDSPASPVYCAGGYVGEQTQIIIQSASSALTHTITYSFGSLTGVIASGTSVTTILWNIPDSFAGQMTEATKQGTITCYTYDSGSLIGSTTCTFTVSVNKSKGPTFSPSIRDTNSLTVSLTGNNQKVVRGVSTLAISSGVQVQQGTLESCSITIGSQIINGTDVIVQGAQSGTIIFSATDSFGASSRVTYERVLIPYIRPSVAIEATDTTISGELSFTITGNFFNDTFGVVRNSATVQYRLKPPEADWSAWQSAAITTRGNAYTFTGTITGLDYRQPYGLQARIWDELSNAETEPIIKRGMPIFDFGVDDLRFNVPIDAPALFISNVEMVDFTATDGTVGDWHYTITSNGHARLTGAHDVYITYTEPTTGGWYYYDVTLNWPLFNLSVKCVNITLFGAGCVFAMLGAVGRDAVQFRVCSSTYLSGVSLKAHVSVEGEVLT